jgi:hypothetical protein
MKNTLVVLNELEHLGTIDRYAIGGAVGVFFYVEPALTYDLDVFVQIPVSPAGVLVLTSIYDELRARGYEPDGECVLVEGTPVQFLPAYNDLLVEALENARSMDYNGVTTRVLRAEHLAAICVQTGRAKDRERVRMLTEQDELDGPMLASILERFGLTEKWHSWTS